MPKNAVKSRDQAHELIERLSQTQITALVKLLETMIDPVGNALRNAPADDEPESGDERRAVQEARRWLKANNGQGVPHRKAMEQLGLK